MRDVDALVQEIRDAEAALAYEAAIARTENATERAFLQRRRRAITQAKARGG
jgi:predicted RNA polymerase sigma factor